MRRAGSTVRYYLPKEIIETETDGKALGFFERCPSRELYHKRNRKGKNSAVKCHRSIPGALSLSEIGEASAISAYRDLRDVAVSEMKRGRRDFGARNAMRSLGKCVRDRHDWQSIGGIRVTRYESMISDLKQEALRSARHLDIDLTDAFALELAEKCALDHQINRIRDSDCQHRGIRLGENLTVDPEALLFSNHICPGRSGLCKNALSSLEVTFREA